MNFHKTPKALSHFSTANRRRGTGERGQRAAAAAARCASTSNGKCQSVPPAAGGITNGLSSVSTSEGRLQQAGRASRPQRVMRDTRSAVLPVPGKFISSGARRHPDKSISHISCHFFFFLVRSVVSGDITSAHKWKGGRRGFDIIYSLRAERGADYLCHTTSAPR